jgi:hypothetical protein
VDAIGGSEDLRAEILEAMVEEKAVNGFATRDLDCIDSRS